MSIEDKSSPLSSTAPPWYLSPDIKPNAQIKKASDFLELHGGKKKGYRPSDIPPCPYFTPRTEKEVLLLTVMLPSKGCVKGFRRTFDSWWDFIVPPTGLTKWRWEELKSNSKRLRLAKGIEYKPGIRWVAFDPNTYQANSTKQALALSLNDDNTLAHAEVLMAAAMFPDWVNSWDGRESPYPLLSGLQFYRNPSWSLAWLVMAFRRWLAGSGLQFYRNPSWSMVPDLRRWLPGSQIRLDAVNADSGSSDYSSPVVREC